MLLCNSWSKVHFVYLEPKSKVYTIIKPRKQELRTTQSFDYSFYQQMFTKPFLSKETEETRNVLIAFVNEEICKQELSCVEGPMLDTDGYEPSIRCMNVHDVEFASDALSIPAAIVQNVYCDIETREQTIDVHFHMSAKHNNTSYLFFSP